MGRGRARAALVLALCYPPNFAPAVAAAATTAGPASASWDWLRGTVWDWNNWRHVTFHDDGRFEAPTDDCQEGRCQWFADDRGLEINWGDAGKHVLSAGADRRSLSGTRVQDSSSCSAVFVRTLPKDPYKVLGVERTATTKEVKAAYRQLTLVHHPDKGGDPEHFNEIQEAYETLSDPDKREMYDTGGVQRFTNRGDWLEAVQKGQVSVSRGFYAYSETVQVLTSANFHTFTSSAIPALVEFYAPWCSHCQDMVPEYRRAGAMLDGQAVLGAVNCEDQRPLCQQNGINSYPTIIAMHRGEQEIFSGAHSAEALRDFVLAMAENRVVQLTADRFKREVGRGDHWLVDFSAGPWCGPCTSTKPALRAAAQALSEVGVKVGIVDCDSQGSFCQQVGVPHYPLIRAYRAGDGWSSGGTPLELQSHLPAVSVVQLFADIAKMLLPKKVEESANASGEGAGFDHAEL